MTLSDPRRVALVWVVGFLLLVGATPPGTRAQEPSGGESPAATGTDEAARPRRSEESFLRWMIRSSGPIGAVILALSFYLVALVVWMAFEYRHSVALPAALIREVNELLAQKRYPDAFQRVATDYSFLARTLTAGVRKLPSGLPGAQRAMEMVNEDVTMEMEHRTTYLATVGTLGPMIGLLGTVYGMIHAFRVMGLEGTSPQQAGQLAAGISTALFATLEGIGVSIPAISFYAFFRNRIARLSLEVELAAESMLEQFAPGVRTPHPLATTAGQQRTALGGPGT